MPMPLELLKELTCNSRYEQTKTCSSIDLKLESKQKLQLNPN